ncbi:DUF3466 family protein [Lentzea sp. HUAS12]|uniref:DUF3466 family protein n=1 Tax=Lentzea sp. HUAS12 TaxID=2951806 RepID=UPI0020A1CB78|nr:DUF3466 family protein [Lentzea sp. HUAS12]USX54919.1 DUF3466 family protein [Lentzea sp. HUAS12]
MKRTRAALPCLVVLATLVAAPQASADACQYTKQDLPVPAGATANVFLSGGSADNSRIAGSAQVGQDTVGAYWANSTLLQLPPSPTGANNVIPVDVNNTGVITGSVLDTRDGMPRTVRAFRYENGAYEFLETDAGVESDGRAINQAGDVAGTHGTDLYLWPRGGARKLIAANTGLVLGITDDGKIVTAAPGFTAKVYDVNGGPTVDIPRGSAGGAVMDNNSVFIREKNAAGEITTAEYDLNGVKITSRPIGSRTFGRNSSGTVWGTYVKSGFTQVHALWSTTGRTDLVADPMPLVSTYSDITDAATLIGTYRADQNIRPARWFWTCS